MAKVKQPPSVINEIRNNNRSTEAFVSYSDPSDRAAAFKAYGNAIDKIEVVQRSTGALANQYQNIDNNASIRSGFSRIDYEFFRPAEQVPRAQKQIISACMAAYDKIGIIRNVIDTMGDFASQGVRWTHPNPKIEEFYNSWARKIGMQERSERFLNLLYRSANVLIKRSRGKLRQKHVDDFKRGIAETHLDFQDDYIDVRSREIPLRYTFLNPMTIEVVAEELSAFTGKFYYTIKVNPKLISLIQNPRDEYEVGMVDSIPNDIIGPIKAGKKNIKISDDDLLTFFYKKDDWQVWANPMVHSMLDDLIAYEKMKLADLAALDGAIAHIRIWKLGSLEHEILPTDAAVQKLADLLLNNVGGGSMDLIWGPDLELTETSTEIHKFLGSTKYETCLMNIYAGLGVPPTMTGSGGTAGGFNENFISLKTLTERLRYGRGRLNEFWEYEARFIQKAMGFREPPTLLYDYMNLSDEVAEKALWIQLVDRMIISERTLQERFGVIPKVERKRLDKEYGQRKKGALAPKASPFFDVQPKLSLEKIFAQRGQITPSEVGIVLEERSPDEKSPLELQNEQQIKLAKIKGQPGQGRPLNKKDSKQRKKRPPQVTKASENFVNTAIWAKGAQKVIADITTPFFLEKFGKENLRQLTEAESEQFEKFKFVLLQNIPAFAEVNADYIYNLIQNPLPVYKGMEDLTLQFADEFLKRKNAPPSIDEIRQIHCFVYSIYKGELDGEDNLSD